MTVPLTQPGAVLPLEALPLLGIRVVECGAHLGVAYAGRLLADLGADVVKLETPAGDPLRHRGPYVGGISGPERSAAAIALHAGKRSVVVQPDDVELVAGLLDHADIVLRDRAAAGPQITQAALDAARTVNPGLIVADVTAYGASGPLAGRDDPDLVVLARSGMLSITSTIGSASTDPGPSTPLRYVGDATWTYAGLHATVAALGALHARRHHGLGQQLDISALEALVAVLATSVPQYTYAGKVVTHETPKIVRPWAIYDLVDGQVSVQCSEDSQWRGLARILGHEEWVERTEWVTTDGRVADAESLEAHVAAAMATQTLPGFLAAAHAAGVPATEVQTNADVLAWPQLVEREFFTTMHIAADDEPLVVPGPPLRFDLAVPRRHTAAPRLGEHTDDVLDDWRTTERDLTVEAPGDTAAAALAGVRVVDMTWVWAGPFATMQLAYLGADVVKIESPNRIDLVRRLGPYAGGVVGINRSGYFNQYNQGKRSIALDLTSAADRATLDRLIGVSNLIVDNMRSGALVRMGYDEPRLRALNANIVATAMTGFGDSGPDKDRAAYGAIINSLSGIASITGRPEGGPVDLQLSLADPCSGLHAAVGMLAALYRQRVTGRGGRVDCAMVEAWIAACPWGVLAESCGEHPVAVGNQDVVLCPNGVFPCVGDDEWVAIAVDGDTQFAALAAVAHLGDGFDTVESRRAREDELEAAVAAWTSTLRAPDVVAQLEAVGVAAARVDRMDDVLASAQLAARRFFTELDHPEVGPLRLAGPPYRGSLSAFSPTIPPPCLGQHTADVLLSLGIDPTT